MIRHLRIGGDPCWKRYGEVGLDLKFQGHIFLYRNAWYPVRRNKSLEGTVRSRVNRSLGSQSSINSHMDVIFHAFTLYSQILSIVSIEISTGQDKTGNYALTREIAHSTYRTKCLASWLRIIKLLAVRDIKRFHSYNAKVYSFGRLISIFDLSTIGFPIIFVITYVSITE